MAAPTGLAGATGTLAGRIVLLAVLVAVAGVTVTGIATFGLFRQGATQAAETAFARDADTFAASTDGLDQRRNPRQKRIQSAALRQLLKSRQITLDEIGADEDPASALVPPFTTADVAAVRASGRFSSRRRDDLGHWLIEGRTSGTTTLLLAQPVNEAVAQSRFSRGRLAVPLLLGLLGGGLAGLLLARQIAAPLGRLSTAARRLSGGDRTVRVPPDGPREVADVAQALNGLAAALADSEARQRRFLMNVSHELRTPLTAVSGYAEGLADGVITGNDEVRAAGTVIRDEAARLDHRVDDLLALARTEADDFRLRIAPADLTDLVRAAGRAWQPRAEAAGVRLRVSAEGLPIIVDTDAERVRQAIDALADNALRVLSPGRNLMFGCGIERLTEGVGSGSVAWVEVRDDGPGLDADDLAVAFDRGRLTERYRGERPVGSGLGLALVGELARRLGGTARARPGPEGGVSFVIRLPG